MLPEEWLATTLEDAAGCPVYPVMGREGQAPPYVVYMRDMTADQVTLGMGVGDQAQVEATYIVDIYADSYLQSRTIAASIRQAVRNFSGEQDGLTILNVAIDNDRDVMPVLLDGRDSPTYTVEQFLKITSTE